MVIADEQKVSRINVILSDQTVKKILLATLCIPGLVVSPLPGIAGDPLYQNADEGFYYDYSYGPEERIRRSSRDNPDVDTNSCLEGSVIGGLLGAGLGAALSRGNGRWVGVPVGGAAGALIGCQVDGG